jgi:hypothetical protein
MARVQPSTALMKFYDQTSELLDHKPSAVFFPHMSLVYSDIWMDKRRDVKRELEIQIALTISLAIRRVEIWKTEGSTTDWALIKSVKL